jgi:hypothetical protein
MERKNLARRKTNQNKDNKNPNKPNKQTHKKQNKKQKQKTLKSIGLPCSSNMYEIIITSSVSASGNLSGFFVHSISNANT